MTTTPAAGGRTRAETKRDTREALLQAGLAEFAERGIDAPSLDAICARAGFTRGAFYVHFRDRADFLVAVMERILGALFDAVIGTGERGDLTSTVHRFAELLQSRPGPAEDALPLHRLLEACGRSPELRQRFAALLGEAAERVGRHARSAAESGRLPSAVAPEAVGQLLVTLALGAAVVLETGVEADVAALRDTVLRLFQPG